jgi:ketopantoate reductase
MKVAVAGFGSVGLLISTMLSEKNEVVCCYDISKNRYNHEGLIQSQKMTYLDLIPKWDLAHLVSLS